MLPARVEGAKRASDIVGEFSNTVTYNVPGETVDPITKVLWYGASADANAHQTFSVTKKVEGELPDEIKTTREKFIEAKNRFEQNPMANLPPEALSDMTIRKREGGQKSIFVNGVQLRMRANGYTPLEVE